jgi:hypothetical protein
LSGSELPTFDPLEDGVSGNAAKTCDLTSAEKVGCFSTHGGGLVPGERAALGRVPLNAENHDNLKSINSILLSRRPTFYCKILFNLVDIRDLYP